MPAVVITSRAALLIEAVLALHTEKEIWYKRRKGCSQLRRRVAWRLGLVQDHTDRGGLSRITSGCSLA